MKSSHHILQSWLAKHALTATEKSDIYRRIVQHAPVPNVYRSTARSGIWFLPSSRVVRYAAIIGIIGMGYSTFHASAQALPGDFAYPVKIAHERVTYYTTSTPDKKLELSLEILHKRIAENKKLIAKKSVTPANEKIILQSLARETEHIQTETADLKTTDSVKALEYQDKLATVWETYTTNLLESYDPTAPAVTDAREQAEKIHDEKTELQNTILTNEPEKAQELFDQKLQLLQTDTASYEQSQNIAPESKPNAEAVSDNVITDTKIVIDTPVSSDEISVIAALTTPLTITPTVTNQSEQELEKNTKTDISATIANTVLSVITTRTEKEPTVTEQVVKTDIIDSNKTDGAPDTEKLEVATETVKTNTAVVTKEVSEPSDAKRNATIQSLRKKIKQAQEDKDYNAGIILIENLRKVLRESTLYIPISTSVTSDITTRTVEADAVK